MYTYYRLSPRGFANEDTIVRADEAHRERIEACVAAMENDPNAWAHRITRRAAEARTASNRKAYRTGQANYQTPAGATEIVDAADYIDL